MADIKFDGVSINVDKDRPYMKNKKAFVAEVSRCWKENGKEKAEAMWDTVINSEAKVSNTHGWDAKGKKIVKLEGDGNANESDK